MLEGKVVLITGAAHGLGLAYALAAGGAGAAVVAMDVDEEHLDETVSGVRSAGGTCEPFVGSVDEWDVAAAAVDLAVRRFGRLDGLVNNAAIFNTGLATAETEERLRNIVHVNILGVLYVGTHALRVMSEQGSGSIVNVTSAARGGREQMSAYGATKGAVVSATYSWALEAREHGVRVNAVAPRALTRMISQGRASSGHLPPQAVAPLVVFLLSDAAVGIQGQVVHFDGERLALATAPRWVARVSHTGAWTAEAIAEAFDTRLRDELQPVGWPGGAVSDESAASLAAGA